MALLFRRDEKKSGFWDLPVSFDVPEYVVVI